MKYFEFKTNASGNYYALICATNRDRAVSLYKSDVAELDGNDAGPIDISRDDAKMKYLKISKNSEENAEYSDTAEDEVLLIDGDLV